MYLRCLGKKMSVSVGKHAGMSKLCLAALLSHFLFILHCALKSDAKFWVLEI